jgi:hypothetical protein
VAFNAFTREEGLGRELRRRFGHLKKGHMVVYPMHSQLELLIDACVAGASRVFDLEWLAADPIFTRLSGGAVPSIDVLYDDLRRFSADELEAMEELVADHGLHTLRARKWKQVTLDIDTTVTPLFGSQEGARPGPNPRYHGRPSYHPILARVAETNTVVGARLRPGDTALGSADVEDVEQWLDRVRDAVGPRTIVTVRIDAGGDCAALLDAIHDKGAHFVVKMRQSPELYGATLMGAQWRTVDRDAFGRPTRQVAVIPFERDAWKTRKYRVIAVRTTERDTGRQIFLWNDLEYSVQFYITNDFHDDEDEVARRYDDRAGIEPLIGELKGSFGIGKASTSSFEANEAAFLVKMLAYNLLRRWVTASHAAPAVWHAEWVRRMAICVPARLLRSGRRWTVRLAHRPLLN